MKKTTRPAHLINSKEPHIVSLMLLSAFAAMGAILMTPALPEISAYFHISIGTTQLTVTSFLLGYAIGQLVYGPIANRLGRKPALFIGIGIATMGSIFSILSSPVESFHLLIIGRLLEAIGASAGLAICFTIINDFYFPEDARRITSFLMFAFAIVPGVAIAIGGVLTQYIHWQACFYFLLCYGLFLLYPTIRLPETIGNKDLFAFRYRYIIKNYGKSFLNRKLVGCAICAGFSSACIYTFGAEGPFIGIHFLHIAPATYGILGLIPFIGTFFGSFVTIWLIRFNSFFVLKIAFLLELIASVVMLIFFVCHYVTLFTLLGPMFLLCLAHPMLSSTGLSLAITQTEDKANGSAVMSFIAMAMPVLMTLLLGLLHIKAVWIMPAIFLISLFFMLNAYIFLVRPK